MSSCRLFIHSWIMSSGITPSTTFDLLVNSHSNIISMAKNGLLCSISHSKLINTLEYSQTSSQQPSWWIRKVTIMKGCCKINMKHIQNMKSELIMTHAWNKENSESLTGIKQMTSWTLGRSSRKWATRTLTALILAVKQTPVTYELS